MRRFSEDVLSSWFSKERRKPLIIRGARQVGKSTLVRNFAKINNLDLAEINLERHPLLEDIFKTLDVERIVREIEALTDKRILSPRTLLFFDEIQAAPSAIPALRYFYEDLPDLPVIAAGSLLEFTLSKHNYSMPVGRVEYLHLGPMSFEEFLTALDDESLVKYLQGYQLQKEIPLMTHKRLLSRQREFLFVGGMPEAVLKFKETKSIKEVVEIHRSVIQTYQDDFAKYAKGAVLNRLHRVLNVLPKQAGKKVKYSNISKEDRAKDLRDAIDLLIKARLLLPAWHSDCSGIPIKAGMNDNVFKLYFLDTGLLCYLSGLDWSYLSHLDERELVNEGPLAEQFVAQHLAYLQKGFEPPDLFYWLRESKSQNAEVDFVLQLGKEIIPIEVKAGKSGQMKSLQQYIISKKGSIACRFDLNPPSKQNIRHELGQKEDIAVAEFTLISLPLYLIERCIGLISSLPTLQKLRI